MLKQTPVTVIVPELVLGQVRRGREKGSGTLCWKPRSQTVRPMGSRR